ncbi:MAG: hypothetical protein FJ090_12850 [Deltaproteobacteria bacterium]|nr:hypothetical protein [Deltaproteobacteria bacterium]
MIDTALLVARVLGFAMTSSVRPAATCFSVQLLALGLVHFEYASLPASAAWSVSPLALGLGLAACLLEAFLHHTEGVDELVRALHADKLVAAILTVPTTLLLASLTAFADAGVTAADAAMSDAGLSAETRAEIMAEAEAQAHEALGDAPAASGAAADDLTRATQKLVASGRPPAEQAGLLGLALLVNFALTWLRGEVREVVESLEFERLWAWLESGGVFAALLLLAFAPALGLAFVVLLALGAAAAWVVGRGVALVADAAKRRQCPDCRSQIRVEAQLCRHCGAEVTPLRWLGDPASAPAAPLARKPTVLAIDGPPAS